MPTIKMLRKRKFQITFKTLKYLAKVLVLGMIILTGCSGQKIYVYEKLPEVSECRRYTDYWTVNACNREHQIILSEKLNGVIGITNYRLSRKFLWLDCRLKVYYHFRSILIFNLRRKCLPAKKSSVGCFAKGG